MFREVLSRLGKDVHLFLRHSPRTCKIPPERACLLVQSTASLQRFASGSDSASEQFISLTCLWPANLVVAAIQDILRTAQFRRVPPAQTMVAERELAWDISEPRPAPGSLMAKRGLQGQHRLRMTHQAAAGS